MDRRTFLRRSSWLTVGGLVASQFPAAELFAGESSGSNFSTALYESFRDPLNDYRPFVRWWWNGNKVNAQELIRELHLLHKAGVGGVEINPVKFPEEADDLGQESVLWLSQEWIDLLQVVFNEAKRIGMTCDLIVGSGWPFGGEFLETEERGEIVVLAVKRIEGGQLYECSTYEICREADPAVNNPYSGRTMEILSLHLTPEPVTDLSQMQPIDVDPTRELYQIEVPEGKHALVALVKISGFMEIINGVPGANGPIVNHFDGDAMQRYLYRMSDAITATTGALSEHIRAFFVDGLELEGANWCSDMEEQFKRRRGYDLMPWLPLLMYKTGSMGMVIKPEYAIHTSGELTEQVNRVRYDFCQTKAELIDERCFEQLKAWCHKNGVQARLEAYGNGAHPLNSSLIPDIPEGESWTMNYLKHRLGEEMPNDNAQRGRGYTMINKYVSSAAHLKGARIISAEDMTNTYTVFNASLEFLKLGTDQSILSGITHSVFHGFNYSPPESSFPGWVRYGAYYSEKNNWWPYFHHFTDYKARLSALLQQSEMYADVAILPPVGDMWSELGMQSEPFPKVHYPPYLTLLWEAIHKNGSGCDYLSDEVICASQITKGEIRYGSRSYSTLLLASVERINPETLKQLLLFVEGGGKVLCLERRPTRCLGLYNCAQRDQQVVELVARLESYTERFAYLSLPENQEYIPWYSALQEQYALKPYLCIERPDPFFSQIRSVGDHGEQVLLLINSHLHNPYKGRVLFSKELRRGRYPWVWDTTTGERGRIELDSEGGLEVDLGGAENLLLVFTTERSGRRWEFLPSEGANTQTLTAWDLELQHSLLQTVEYDRMESLQDLKDTQWENFTGTVIYRTKLHHTLSQRRSVLNLGAVAGVAELTVNGEPCGVRWAGRRLYELTNYLREGENNIEVRVVTTMGNYVRTMSDNPTAMKWTTGRKEQLTQSMGLTSEVTLYEI